MAHKNRSGLIVATIQFGSRFFLREKERIGFSMAHIRIVHTRIVAACTMLVLPLGSVKTNLGETRQANSIRFFSRESVVQNLCGDIAAVEWNCV